MRTNEERISAMHEMADRIKKEKTSRKGLIISACATAVCLAVLVLIAFVLPDVSASVPGSAANTLGSASIFSGSPFLGHIVIAIIAFLLGIALTIFCFRLRRWQAEKAEITSKGTRKDK